MGCRKEARTMNTKNRMKAKKKAQSVQANLFAGGPMYWQLFAPTVVS